MKANSCFRNISLNPSAQIRLLCFPYAGSSSSIFDSWRDQIDSHIELLAYELPGRGSRFCEPAFYSLEHILEELTFEVEKYLDKPIALFGHSNGSLIAYELAYILQTRFNKVCDHVFLSARKSASIAHKGKHLHSLNDESLISELRTLGGTPEEVLNNADLLSIILPIIRADFSISETYCFKNRLELHSNYSLFRGSEDHHVNIEQLIRWRELFSGFGQEYVFPGDHFFIHSHQHQLVNKINESLTTMVNGFSIPSRYAEVCFKEVIN
ncbi:MAG: thioesterase domain-containing protein [Gammaproteobacteria bacterium]|nr:thioesterase domain-containing protein [Gammaproteobacteria bacterium]MDH5731755.1 thioesterase domain-containing protein [Gammaproteobacteria bacterium]